MAISFRQAAREGAEIKLRFGGKSAPEGGEPIDAQVTAMRTVEEGWQGFRASCTRTCEPDAFANLGVDFAPVAAAIVCVAAPAS